MVSQEDFDALVSRVEALENASKAPVVASDSLPATTGKTKRATRLPQDWFPTGDVVEKIVRELNIGTLDLAAEHEKFTDYWIAVPGQRGVKLDWDATWRNWMRKAFERPRPRNTISKVDSKAASYLEDV